MRIPTSRELDIIKEKPLSNYRKALVAAAGVATALGVVFADGAIDGGEWGYLATAVLVALGVERVPNKPPA